MKTQTRKHDDGTTVIHHGDGTSTWTVPLDPELAALIEEYATDEGITIDELAKRALEEYFNQPAR